MTAPTLAPDQDDLEQLDARRRWLESAGQGRSAEAVALRREITRVRVARVLRLAMSGPRQLTPAARRDLAIMLLTEGGER